MKDYEIYFDLFGRKMKTTIRAINKDVAESVLRQKIQIHSIKVKPNEASDFLTFFNSIVNEK
jgi:hypothetical protein